MYIITILSEKSVSINRNNYEKKQTFLVCRILNAFPPAFLEKALTLPRLGDTIKCKEFSSRLSEKKDHGAK